MKYRANIISICNWASEGVGFSDAQIDHPFIPKPGSVIYDYVDLYKPMGRHPVTKLALWIDEPTTARREQEVEEDGIGGMSTGVSPPLNNPIDASLCSCRISNDLSVIEIDDDPKYLIWGVTEVDGDPLPPAFEDWLATDPVSVDRQDAFNAFMAARGTDLLVLEDYWLDNPGATYNQVSEDFDLFI